MWRLAFLAAVLGLYGRATCLDVVGGAEKPVSRSDGSGRPQRGSAFDAPDADGDAPSPTEPAAAAADGAGERAAPSPGGQTSAIADDMRAHLRRREKKAEADLIVQNRGPVARVVFGLGGFLRSKYFKNVRKSMGVFVGMWLWYVLNTKTYMPPEIEE